MATHVPDDAADGTRGEDVEAVAVPEDELELRSRVIDRARNESIRARRRTAHKSRSTPNSDQTHNRS